MDEQKLLPETAGVPVKPVENRQPNGTFGPQNNANPNGRPKKGHALTDLLREILEENPALSKAIMAKLLEGAAKGDIVFIREVLDRLEGKPTQKQEIVMDESIDDVINELNKSTDYEQLARDAEKQVVANDPSLQNKG